MCHPISTLGLACLYSECGARPHLTSFTLFWPVSFFSVDHACWRFLFKALRKANHLLLKQEEIYYIYQIGYNVSTETLDASATVLSLLRLTQLSASPWTSLLPPPYSSCGSSFHPRTWPLRAVGHHSPLLRWPPATPANSKSGQFYGFAVSQTRPWPSIYWSVWAYDPNIPQITRKQNGRNKVWSWLYFRHQWKPGIPCRHGVPKQARLFVSFKYLDILFLLFIS